MFALLQFLKHHVRATQPELQKGEHEVRPYIWFSNLHKVFSTQSRTVLSQLTFQTEPQNLFQFNRRPKAQRDAKSGARLLFVARDA